MAYLDRSRRHGVSPAGLGFALLINGGLAGALLLVAPKGIAELPLVLQGYDVPDDPPPLPVDEVKRPTPPVKPYAKPRAPERSALVARPDDALGFDFKPAGSGEASGSPLLPPPPPPDRELAPPERTPVIVQPRPDPRYADRLQPPYPSSMVRAGLGGLVIVRVLIGTDGRVKSVEPVSATDEAFLKATRDQALTRWRFSPATRDGVAMESWREMTVRFVLPD